MIENHNALDQYHDVMGNDAREFINDIIKTFLEDAPKQFALLDQSLIDRDAAGFQRAAHTLKSNFKVVGATGLSEQSFVLEQKGASGDLSSVSPIISELNQGFEILKMELLKRMDQE